MTCNETCWTIYYTESGIRDPRNACNMFLFYGSIKRIPLSPPTTLKCKGGME